MFLHTFIFLGTSEEKGNIKNYICCYLHLKVYILNCKLRKCLIFWSMEIRTHSEISVLWSHLIYILTKHLDFFPFGLWAEFFPLCKLNTKLWSYQGSNSVIQICLPCLEANQLICSLDESTTFWGGRKGK